MSLPSKRSAALRTSTSRASGRSSRAAAAATSQPVATDASTSSSAGVARGRGRDVQEDEDFDVVEIASKPATKRSRKSKVDASLPESCFAGRQSQSSQTAVSSWLTSSFGSSGVSSTSKSTAKSSALSSKQHPSGNKGSRSFLTWCDKHKPNRVDDLAIHRKKIEEVQSWMERIFSTKRGTPSWNPPITLLTGPAGCGKSTTVQVLCQAMHADLHEWQNPTVVSSWKPDGNRDDAMPYESEVQSFRDFLLRANKYGSIALKGLEGGGSPRRVLLVEELPNILYRQPSLLHTILGDYAKLGCSPLVFVSSDCPRSDISTAQLFPERILCQIGVNSIHFNPIAQTSLVKCLTRILSAESSASSLDKVSIEGLAASSCGDIRSAVNSLQFACRRDTRDLRSQFHAAKASSTRSSSSRSSSKPASSSLSSRPSSTKGQATSALSTSDAGAVGGRDTALFLFRALGKVLYCKRDTASATDSSKLPSHLQAYSRQPVLVQAEDILDHSHLSTEMFSLYLHQNYLSFHTDIDNVAAASEYLSFSALLANDWTARSLSSQMSGSLSCRSIMYANDGVSSTPPGWKPLHKPQWLSVRKERQQRVSSGQYFLLYGRAEKLGAVHSHEAVYTELLPTMGKLKSRFLSPDHIAFIHATAHYPGETRHRSRAGLQALGEQDVDDGGGGDGGGDGGDLPSSQVLHTSFSTAATTATTTSGTQQASAGLALSGTVPSQTSASVANANAVVEAEVLDALGDDLLTNEDIDAFLDFDDDDGEDAIDGGGNDGDVPAKEKDDVVEEFSDDDKW